MRFPFFVIGILLAGAACAADNSALGNSPSAFVRAQASSTVQWHPWTDASLAEAQKANRSVYVFIGSPLSELSRATIAQTFTQPKTVAWLNENFYCIFVDADAQPDVAAYGQHYIRSIKQLKGSPVHLWLTPDLKIYDGANYLPPSEEWGKPGYLKAARSALDTWTGDANRARALAKEALDLMKVPPLDKSVKIDVAAKLAAAAKAWVATIDPVNGGFGGAPKQPEPELIRFLLTRSDAASRDAAINAARALVKGGAHDPVGGGFYRRCIDEEWKEPYRQRTVADQARIALALFDAANAAKDKSLRDVASHALEFASDMMQANPSGGLISAWDGTFDDKLTYRVGPVSTGTLGLLAVAQVRSDEENRTNRATWALATLKRQITAEGTLSHTLGWPFTLGLTEPGSAADYLAVALAFRVGKDEATANLLLAKANELYFDAATGTYQVSPTKLPSAIAMRVPTSGDTPAAEVLALLAGVDAQTADLIRRNLLSAIEYDDQPPGDVLLGLAQK